MRTILTCAVLMACAACTQNAPSPPAKPDTAAETAAIEKLEQAQIAAITARDPAGATSVYADDAVFIGDRGETEPGQGGHRHPNSESS